MKKRIFGIILVLCMVLTLLPTMAAAQETTPLTELWVGEVQAFGGTSPAPSGEGWSYADGVLTLDNYTYNGEGHSFTYESGQRFASVYAAGDLTIVLEGESGSSVTNAAEDSYGSHGVFVSGSLTITGGGSLTAAGGESNLSVGIYTSDAITISGENTAVTAAGGKGDKSSGIYAPSMTIQDDAKVIATGDAENNAGEYSAGVSVSKDLTIKDSGSLIATGGEVNGEKGLSVGVHVEDVFNIQDFGSLTAEGGAVNGTGEYSVGVHVDKNFAIQESGSLTATGGTVNTSGQTGRSVGLYASNVSITGGTVDAVGGAATTTSESVESTASIYGISALIYSKPEPEPELGTISITGGTVTANNKGENPAILASHPLIVGDPNYVMSISNALNDDLKAVTRGTGDLYTRLLYKANAGKPIVIKKKAPVVDPEPGPIPGGAVATQKFITIKGDKGTAEVPATVSGNETEITITKDVIEKVGSNPNVDAFPVTNEQLLVAADAETASKIESLGVSTVDSKKKANMLAELVLGYDHRINDVMLGVSLFPEKDSVTAKNNWYLALMPRVGYLITPQFELYATAAVRGAQFRMVYSDVQDTNPAAPGDTAVSELKNPVGFAAYVKNGSGGASDTKFYVLFTEKIEGALQARANILEALSSANRPYIQDAVQDISKSTEEGIFKPYRPNKPDVSLQSLSNSVELRQVQAVDLDKFVFFLADLPFTDIADSDWFFKDVSYVWLTGIMEGVSADTFDPAGVTSRAMLTTMLWRLEGEPVVNYALPFVDVAEDKWYTEAVRWAASEKIAEGYDAMFFGPNHPVTREQTAAILWRYAKNKGYDVSVGEDTNILSYDDAFDISEYAIPAIQWAYGAGILQGSEGSIMPLARASRAEIAAVFHRFMMGVG